MRYWREEAGEVAHKTLAPVDYQGKPQEPRAKVEIRDF